nr:hypothetical protein [Halorussus salinisoli]
MAVLIASLWLSEILPATFAGKTPPSIAEAGLPTSVIYSFDFVSTVVPESDFWQLRDQLPESEDDADWGKLFEVTDAGGWGEAQEKQTGGDPQPDAESEAGAEDPSE